MLGEIASTSRRVLAVVVVALAASADALAEDTATLGINQFYSPWTDSQTQIQKAFEGRDLPAANRSGIFIVGLQHRHARGIKNRDIIFEIQGKKLTSKKAYEEAMRRLVVGKPTRIKVLRIEPGEAASKWKAITVDTVPLSAAELAAERTAFAKKYAETVFRFSYDLLAKTGSEIDQLNAENGKQCRRLTSELEDGFKGPRGESFTYGCNIIEFVVERLESRPIDEERGVTCDQDLASNWAKVDEFMRRHLKQSNCVDEDFAAKTVFGGRIVTFDDGTALFYREVWELAKERVR